MNQRNWLLERKTTTGRGKNIDLITTKPSVQLSGSTSSGAGSAVVDILASLDGANFGWVATITMALSTTVSTELFNDDIGTWGFLSCNVTSITGTGAGLDLLVGQ